LIFARRWSTHEARDFSKKRFDEFSSIMVQELPGYYAMGLINPDLTETWVVPANVPIADVVLDPKNLPLLQQAKRSRQAVLSEPFESVQGATTVCAVLPLYQMEEFLGYLVVDFNADELINDCFHERIRSNYHFIVRDGARLIFQSTPEIDEKSFAAASINADVSLQVRNRNWHLDMIPRKEKVKAYGWSVSLPLPLFGIFMSIGLSWLVFLLLRRIDMYRSARDQQILLARKVLMAQEEERARIARELHDELGQLLTALRLEMGWLEKSISGERKNETGVMFNSIALIEQAAGELRRMCKGLRPPLLDDLGIEPAVRLLVNEFKELSAINVRLTLELDDKTTHISEEIALCVYRILQESLTNISRHAGASQVTIKLSLSANLLTLLVADNGSGFDTDELGELQGWGLQGMRERSNLVGGVLEIRSEQNGGTQIDFHVPLRNQKKQVRDP
ncbi:MAG: histidine kinase, partial [Candidatus Latescibacterota bacterium]